VSSRNVALPIVAGLFMLMIAVLLTYPFQTAVQAQENLLANSGFEEGWYHINGVPELQMPNNWGLKWVDGAKVPGSNTNAARPETRVLPRSQVPENEQPLFFRDGSYCVKIFKGGRPIYTSMYQDVNGLEVGRRYRLVAPIYVDVYNWENKKVAPADPYAAMVRLGVGLAGANWKDANSVTYSGWWSGENVSSFYLAYNEYSFEFVATAPQMTVYVTMLAKWGIDNNGFFLDGFGLYPLEMEQTPTATNLPPPPTPTYGPSPTPRFTPTPRPDGATVHIVESGDTLFGIALMYNIDIDEIRRLNAGSLGPNDIIQPGQALVISVPSETPTPSPLPPPPTPETSAPATSIAETVGGGASICVLAYHDRNSTTFREDEATEELLPNAEFTVANASGVVARHTSDGIHEPHCFTGLAAGTYRVILNPPPGYAPSGPAEWPVAVAEGTSLDIQFGNVRDESALPAEPSEPTPTNENDQNPSGGSTISGIFTTIAKVSGILLLLLAIGAATLFFLNRRRMMM
jgi:LysM repeat protein